ncbi:amidohydrolase [Kordiimonas sediminis]|uniref:Amidohydrolase n=1 Tax=Kordiimonas sediminis TaxID=1735581 RepID=A0A919AJX7_9PROT|nr:amidohydrolase family protein [Kordiimonas sediminis]GHF11342.1 amidohydrolase [Kordiimonas sediminis]
MRQLKSLLAATATLALSVSVSAEDIAITGGTAYTNGGSGKIENATVLVSDGKIKTVQAGGEVPSGYRVIDATGKWVTTGLMVSGSALGLDGVPSNSGVNDATVKKAPSTIALDATTALNADSVIIPNTRVEGVTRAVTGFQSTSDFWLGQGAVIHLGNGEGQDLVVRGKAFVGVSLSQGSIAKSGDSRAVVLTALDTKLEGAKEKPSGDDDKKKSDKPDPEKDALKRVLSGDASLYVEASRKEDILAMIRLKEKHGVDVILSGAEEAWMVADKLAAANIPVIVNAMTNLPGGFDTLGATMKNAVRLNAAGVKVGFVGSGSNNARLMPQFAGNAVANGMPWEDAMAAMTTNPAEIFGIADSYGTLAAGKDADVVVWDGDPIEISSSPDAVLIMGEEIPLVSRQTKLRDRYMAPSRSPAFNR